MKRLISILVVATMLFASIMAMIPASANEAVNESAGEATTAPAEGTYAVDWKALYDGKTMKAQWGDVNKGVGDNCDFEKIFVIDSITNTELVTRAKSTAELNGVANEARSYFSTTMFEITDSTYYEYVVKANNTRDTGYAGVVFAYANGKPYLTYGSFDNTQDDVKVNGELRGDSAFRGVSVGNFDGYLNGDQSEFVKLKLDNGYGTMKVVYDGFNVVIYAFNENEEWVRVNNTATTLPTGAKVCFGIYCREGKADSGANYKDRSISVKDAVLTAKNREAAAIIAGESAEKVALAAALDAGYAAIEKGFVDTNALIAAGEAAFASGTGLAEAATAINDAVNAWNNDPSRAVAITTAEEFAAMDADGRYILMNDITITAAYADFKGYFNGNGKTITVTNCGVFTTLSGAIVTDLTIAGSIEGSNSIGALATDANGTIAITNVVNNATVTVNSANKNVAGFIAQGKGANITFTNCINNANIIGGRTAGFYANTNSGTNNLAFVNCINNGNIACGGNVNQNPAAGFVARTTDGTTEKIEFSYCTNTGDIKSTYSSGSFFGCGKGEVNILGCVNYGSITVNYTSPQSHVRPIGGLVGGATSSDGAWKVTVKDSFQMGLITVNSNYAGKPVAHLVGGTQGELIIENVVVSGQICSNDNNVYKITSNANANIENAYVYVALLTLEGDVNANAVDKTPNMDIENVSDELTEESNNAAMNLVTVSRTLDVDAKKSAIEVYLSVLDRVVNGDEEPEFPEQIPTVEEMIVAAKEELAKLKKAPDAYTAESYAAYETDFNALIALIDAAETYEDLEAIDVDALIAAAEAKLVEKNPEQLPTVEEIIAAAKAELAKLKKAPDAYTAESYAAYEADFNALIALIEAAKTHEELFAIDVDALIAAAEAKLVEKTAEPTKPADPADKPSVDDGADDKTEDKTDDKVEDETDAKEEETDAKVDETDAQTQAPNNAPAETNAPAKKGCGSSVAISALAILGAVGTAVVLKKKED